MQTLSSLRARMPSSLIASGRGFASSGRGAMSDRVPSKSDTRSSRSGATLTSQRRTASGASAPSGPVAGLASLHELAPASGFDLDAVLPGRRSNPSPGSIAFCVGHALDLIEARDRVADMRGVVERLLSLLGEGELLGW